MHSEEKRRVMPILKEQRLVLTQQDPLYNTRSEEKRRVMSFLEDQQRLVLTQQDPLYNTWSEEKRELRLTRWPQQDLLLQLSHTKWAFTSPPTKHSIIFPFTRREEVASFSMFRTPEIGPLTARSMLQQLVVLFIQRRIPLPPCHQ